MTVRAYVGLQFGDEGKGKIVDAAADGFRLIIRYNGGANAGHTVENALGTFKLHLVPSGIFNPKARCFLGNGAVVDLATLVEELAALERAGVSVERFFVSSRAHLVMPWHKVADALAESSAGAGAIGTTKRGIGPCYADKTARVGIRAGELLDMAALRPRLERLRGEKERWLRAMYPGVELSLPAAEAIASELAGHAVSLGRHIADTDTLARQAWRAGEPILLEAAQGTMIDLEFGTYPYVTSSLATSMGACAGSGLPPVAINEVIGIAKAYTTRVGNGPMPTELLDGNGEALRHAGREFGTTTGRPRRCGWFDAPLVRYAAEANGAAGIVLTKLDVLSAMPALKIATAYRFRGGLRQAPLLASEPYGEYEPVYEDCQTWSKPIAGIRSWRRLPAAAKRYVERIEELVGVPIVAVATGPHRDAVIAR